MLFDILSKYELEAVYIGDINFELINAYTVVRDGVDELVGLLRQMQDEYVPMESKAREVYYARKREQ